MIARHRFAPVVLLLLCCLMAACSLRTATTGSTSPGGTTTSPGGTGVATPTKPLPLQNLTVDQFRKSYGVDQLIAKGFTGKGQSVVDIVSFGSPTLVQDVATFSKRYGLPAADIQQLYPVGPVNFDPSNSDMAGWMGETELDVEIIHALAPDAKIVVLASPVSETEGTVGLPEFRKMEQYAFDNHLGAIVSQSWGASEYTLKDAAGQAELQAWDTFLQSTTKQGITYLAGSGDNGATDAIDSTGKQFVPAPTSSFPNDDPWVTSVGGTTVEMSATQMREVAWQGSGGGFSAFYATPDYQKGVASASPTPFGGKRGLPDVSANANPETGLIINIGGEWTGAGGTSASTPIWAALVAIANQMAGRNLGFINPALYQIAASNKAAQDFHDITVGNNNADASGVAVQGFSAGPGWDAVTGLGSPNAPNLLPDLIAATAGK
ncbi:MAG: S53 family peptidase [Ktedonobacterales bacterium]|nr:S53 family peptidase [Ktedonobacterales bacterium]